MSMTEKEFIRGNVRGNVSGAQSSNANFNQGEFDVNAPMGAGSQAGSQAGFSGGAGVNRQNLAQATKPVFNPVTPAGWIPASDVLETDTNFVLVVDLPGLMKEQINISITEKALIISGERTLGYGGKNSNEFLKSSIVGSFCERASGRFYRNFILPVGLTSSKITSSYNNGVLEIIVPKSNKTEIKTVSVQ